MFKAQNLGIKFAQNEWVCVINSGDKLVRDARSMFEKHVADDLAVECHVYSQIYSYPCSEKVRKFQPTDNSLWPHQSILMKKSVHLRYGFYPTDYKYTAEQIFYAKVRGNLIYSIHEDVLSWFSLGGLSYDVNLQIFREMYNVRRFLGCSYICAFWRGYLTPLLRFLVTKLFGRMAMLKVKDKFLRW